MATRRRTKERRFRPAATTYTVVSLNVNGLTPEKLVTVLGYLKSRKPGAPMAFVLQETHDTIPSGSLVEWKGGCVIIRAAEKVKPVGIRQSRGVAIVLGPVASRAWRDSKGVVLSHDPRHVLASFRMHGRRWALASAYAPDGTGSMEVQERQRLIGVLSRAFEALPKKVILLCGADLNASVGTASSRARIPAYRVTIRRGVPKGERLFYVS